MAAVENLVMLFYCGETSSGQRVKMSFDIAVCFIETACITDSDFIFLTKI